MSADPTKSVRTPVSEASCVALCGGYALWTLCCHTVVALGGGLRLLVAVFAGATLLALLAAFRWRTPSEPMALAPWQTTPETRQRGVLRVVGLGLALAIALAWSLHQNPLILWWSGSALLLAAVVLFAGDAAPRCSRARGGHGAEVALWALALLCVVVALVAHRPDIDDAFYVNVAVAAVGAPDSALLAMDTLHGLPNLPIHLPAYRVHSYELANAALSWLTGIRAIAIFHWLAATGIALSLPLAHAVLFRTLAPARWVWATAALVFVLLAAGETHLWYGNFALVRIWQGKSVYLFVFMPLVYAYAIRFAAQPTTGRWLLLAAAQIAAVGSSSSALWAAPAGAWMAMLCALRPEPRAARTFALGALASLYPLAIAWLLKGSMQVYTETLYDEHAAGEQLAFALASVLGDARLQIAGLAAVLGTWACLGQGFARRFALVLPAGVWILLLAPYLDELVSANLTGPRYLRVMWSLPVPILLALVLTSPLAPEAATRRRGAGIGICLALCAAFALFVPRFGALSERNVGAAEVGFRLGWPSLKVPPNNYRWADRLRASVEPGDRVVAPPAIGLWLPTFHDPVYPLVVRPAYLFGHREALGEANLRLRLVMTRYTAGALDVPEAPELFRRGLEIYNVKGVCLRASDESERARASLHDAGFRRVLQEDDHEIWVRR